MRARRPSRATRTSTDPRSSGGTANATAKSASSAFIARVGSTSTSLAFGVSDVCILAPRTTMPASLRSTTCTCRSGSSCSCGAFERSPFTSVCATATARSFVAAVAVERHEPLELLALQHRLQREQRVGADVLDRQQRAAERGGELDEPHAVEEIVGRARDAVVGAVLLAGLGVDGDREVAVLRRRGRPRSRARSARPRSESSGSVVTSSTRLPRYQSTRPSRSDSRYSAAVRRPISCSSDWSCGPRDDLVAHRSPARATSIATDSARSRGAPARPASTRATRAAMRERLSQRSRLPNRPTSPRGTNGSSGSKS